jgi:hypothetical protein
MTTKEKLGFVGYEIVMFSVQLAIIYVAGMLTTLFFSNMKMVERYVLARINSDISFEFWMTLFAITFVMGVLAIAKELSDFPLINRVTSEAILEIPRTIYLFGSATSGAALIFYSSIKANSTDPEVKMILAKEMPEKYLGIALFIGTVFLLYGMFVKYFIVRKRRQQKAGGSETIDR